MSLAWRRLQIYTIHRIRQVCKCHCPTSTRISSILPWAKVHNPFSSEPTLLSVPFTHSWHEQDADEILQLSSVCIDEAIKNLENDGWSKDSVKVIGIYIYTTAKLQTDGDRRYNQSAWNYSGLESYDRQAIVQGYCVDRFAHKKSCRFLRKETSRSRSQW